MAFINDKDDRDAVGFLYSSTIIVPRRVPQPRLSPSTASTNYRRNRLRDEPTMSTTAIASSSAAVASSSLSTTSSVASSAGTAEYYVRSSSGPQSQQIGASTTSPSSSSTLVAPTATSMLVAAAASSLLQSTSPLTSSPGSASSSSPTVSSLLSSSLFTGSSTLVTRTSLSLVSSSSSSDSSLFASIGPLPSSSDIVISASSTSASLTSSTSLSSPSASPSQHLETGAWVGIAVACAAVGLIVGILAALTFLRRRSKASAELEHSDSAQGAKGSDSQARSSSPPPPPPLPASSSPPPPPPPSQNATALGATAAAGPESLPGSEPDASVSEVDSESMSELGSLPSFHLPVVTDIDRFLPIPRSEKGLISELRSLGHLVQQHVEDKYHYREVVQSADSLSEALSNLGVDGDGDEVPDAKQLAVLTLDPETRQVGLQHIISRVIFDSLSADIIMSTRDTLSLLPPSMTAMLQDMPHCEKHMGNPDAMILAFTRWRLLSVFLLNATRSERGCLVPNEAVIRPKAQQLVTALNKAIGSFVDEDSSQEQKEHLRDVALECAKLGYVILSQPAAYVYRFASFDVRKEIVVCPGLDKVTDEHGAQCIAQVVTGPGVHVL